MSRVLVTGATGFIGTHLVAALRRRGDEVIPLSRSASCSMAPPWTLGDPLPLAHLGHLDAVVHLAWPTSGRSNAFATAAAMTSAIEACARAGVRCQLFVSSASAGQHAQSAYGVAKFEVERAVAGLSGVCSVRPGLVLGQGGIFGRIARVARRLPVVPLPDGGRGYVTVIDVERLVEHLIDLLHAPALPRLVSLSQPEPVRLCDLVRRAAGAPRAILPIPSRWLRIALRAAARCRLPLPVTVDNLDGFLANQLVLSPSAAENAHGHRPAQPAP